MSTWLLRIRRWHGRLAPVVLLPLLITVSTGLGYRLMRDWGGWGRDQAHWLMQLHEGEWLGRPRRNHLRVAQWAGIDLDAQHRAADAPGEMVEVKG